MTVYIDIPTTITISPFMTGNSSIFVIRVKDITLTALRTGNLPMQSFAHYPISTTVSKEEAFHIPSRLSSNSEAKASELLESIEEIFPHYFNLQADFNHTLV